MRLIDFLFFALWLVVGLGFPSVAYSADWSPPQLFLDSFNLDRTRYKENDSTFSGRLLSSDGTLLLKFDGERTVAGVSSYSIITHQIEWSAEPGFRAFLIESLKALSAWLPEDDGQGEPGEHVQWSQVKMHLANLDFGLNSDLAIIAELNLISEMVLGIVKHASKPVASEMGYLHRLMALWLGGFTRQDFFRVALPDLALTVPPLELELVCVDAVGVGLGSGRVQFILRGAGAEQWESMLSRQSILRKNFRPFVGGQKAVCRNALLAVGEALYPDFLGFWKRLLRFP